MHIQEQIAAIKETREFHRKWYCETYPDVNALGMEPIEHYLRYGAALGRNPGKFFNTKWYFETYPDAAASGLNPLVHYALFGKGMGYGKRGPKKSADVRQVAGLRTRLLSLGFTEAPLAELAHLAVVSRDAEARALASRELALWHMRRKNADGYQTALRHLATARRDAPSFAFRQKLAVTELLCHHFLGDDSAAEACFKRAFSTGELSSDLLLAALNLEPTPDQRVFQINRVLGLHDISPIALLPDDGRPAYDRLTSAIKIPKVTDGPRVTVLIAAYDAADTLPTTLRSLQEQSWQNLEILVLDDCSPDLKTMHVAEEFAQCDARIRVIRMEENGGAYVARNRGLNEATGTYVTLHDADDWSHPLKIETQIRFLESHPDVMGCTSQQARAFSDLGFTRWTGEGNFIITNTSSLMFRRAPVKERLGYWDTVRFSGDSEFIRRIKQTFGRDAIVDIETGPFSFQRDSHTSVVADEVMGINGFLFGARRIYADVQGYHRRVAETLKYEITDRHTRHFAVPALMRADRKEFISQNQHFPVILASDFRMTGGSTLSCVEEMKFHHRNGIKLGLVEMFRYDLFGDGVKTGMLDEVHAQIDGDTVQLLAFGDKVSCDTLIIRYPPVLQEMIRYMPQIEAKTIRVIVNQPPMSDYGPEGTLRYDFKTCAENIRRHFGKDAIWHPIGPLVRAALEDQHADELQNIHLSATDWSNIIDVEGWNRGAYRPDPTQKVKIGRHSRDHEHKWPSNENEILAAYPLADDVEVHVLGGSKAASAIIGHVPSNWVVHDFGSLAPREFLSGIDVWSYFANPHWVESFGRTIIEAMAVGVPVILPDVYRPLFQDAALYATPETSVEIARSLHADPDAYVAQVLLAQAYVRTNFSYAMHLDRITASPEKVTSRKSTKQPTRRVATRIKVDPSLPQHSGKTSASALADIPTIDLSAGGRPSASETALLSCTSEGHRFDYLWRPKTEADRLFVLFSGNAQRAKNNPPVFQRWTWADHFPGHCLYVSDPMLHMAPDLGLAWYAGTDLLDPMTVIIRRIRDILSVVGFSDTDVTAYGSSGGGFASLRMASMMPGASAVAINPQTNIAEYKASFADKYANICLKRSDRNVALKEFPGRMSLTSHIPQLSNRNIIIIQNTVDEFHYENHFTPFCSAMGVDADQNLDDGRFRRILFSHEGGHLKAETPEVFAQALQIVASDFQGIGQEERARRVKSAAV